MKKLLDDQHKIEDENYKKHGTKRVLVDPNFVEKIRKAEIVTRTAIHPDTGEFIPWPMRMSSFIPMNLPISYAMIIIPPTPINTIAG